MQSQPAKGYLEALVELLVPRSESTFQVFLLLLAASGCFLGALYILRPVIQSWMAARQKERAAVRREREASHDADVENQSFQLTDHERRLRVLEGARVPDPPAPVPTPVSPPTSSHD